jgi:tRNA threonylcarbamoyladenosine biosynthesis protein TsaB
MDPRTVPDTPCGGPAGGPAPGVLAIDTTAARCSAAVRRGRIAVVRGERIGVGHSRAVFGLIEAVCAQAEVDPGAIDAIAFGCGPGSFTGLRVACATAQGLGLGWGRPVLAVATFRTLAWQAFAAGAVTDVGGSGPEERCTVVVALDLRMGQVCAAVYRGYPGLDSDEHWETLLAPALLDASTAVARFDSLLTGLGAASTDVGSVRPAGLRLAGDGYDAHPALADWAASLGARAWRPADAVQPDAGAVAALAILDWHRGRAVDPAEAAPLYLRDEVALDVEQQARLRAARRVAAR